MVRSAADKASTSMCKSIRSRVGYYATKKYNPQISMDWGTIYSIRQNASRQKFIENAEADLPS